MVNSSVNVFLGSQGLGALSCWLEELVRRPKLAALMAATVTEVRPKYWVRRSSFCQRRSVSSAFSPSRSSRKPQAILWLNGASTIALITSGEASEKMK